MTRILIPALFLMLIVAAPAAPQGAGSDAANISTLVSELSALKSKVAKQEKLLKELVAFHQLRKKHSQKLYDALGEAHRNGFTYPSPQPKARESLYQALRGYAQDGTRNVPTGASNAKAKPKK